MAQQFPDVPIKTQILIGKPFQVIMQWADEIKPTLLVIDRHGAHRIEHTELGSQSENLVRLAQCDVLLTGVVGVRPEDVAWIERDGHAGVAVGCGSRSTDSARYATRTGHRATRADR